MDIIAVRLHDGIHYVIIYGDTKSGLWPVIVICLLFNDRDIRPTNLDLNISHGSKYFILKRCSYAILHDISTLIEVTHIIMMYRCMNYVLYYIL